MHNLTNEELIAENTALKAKISALDKQEPVLYTSKTALRSPFGSLPPTRWPNEIHSSEDGFNALLFTRPPITSERELELLAVIEQMRNAMLAILCDPEGVPCFAGNNGDRKVIADALALTPDLSALKEFEQKIRNDERSKMV